MFNLIIASCDAPLCQACHSVHKDICLPALDTSLQSTLLGLVPIVPLIGKATVIGLVAILREPTVTYLIFFHNGVAAECGLGLLEAVDLALLNGEHSIHHQGNVRHTTRGELAVVRPVSTCGAGKHDEVAVCVVGVISRGHTVGTAVMLDRQKKGTFKVMKKWLSCHQYQMLQTHKEKRLPLIHIYTIKYYHLI